MRRLILLIGAVTFIDTAFFAAITPLLPRYTEALDLSKSAAGVLSASYAGGNLIGAIPGGWLASRVGVKPVLLVALAMQACASLVFGFANELALLDAARFIQGAGGAWSWAAGLAWLMGNTPGGRRGELIGSMVAAAITGTMLGPVLGGVATVVGPKPVFAGVAGIELLLLVLAFSTPGVESSERPSARVFVAALGRRSVLAGFWLVALPALFGGVLAVLVPLRLNNLGATGLAIGAAFFVAAVVEAVLSPVLGRVSDQTGWLVPIRSGLAASAVIAVVLPLLEHALLLAAAVTAVAAATATFWAPAMSLLSDAAERAGLDKGLAFGLTSLAWASGEGVGGVSAGALAEATADAVPYVGLSLLCAVTLLAAMARPRVAQ